MLSKPLINELSSRVEIKYGLDYKARAWADVDSDLSMISTEVNRFVVTEPIPSMPFPFIHNKQFDIYICDNAIPIQLAREVREFVHSIEIDLTSAHLNDTDNLPPRKVLLEARDSVDMTVSTESSPQLSNEWKWQNYASWEYNRTAFWRLYPTTLNAFVYSPIKRLIDLIEAKLQLTSIPDIDIPSLRRLTWVIQVVLPDHGIGAHTDFGNGRKLSFLYYLTDDDWNIATDGGELITGDQQLYKICPKFNMLIAWPMVNGNGPLHSVATVLAPISRPRISRRFLYCQMN